MRQIRHLCNICFFVFVVHLPGCDKWLQTSAEVDHADAGIEYCEKDKDDGDDGEGCHRLSDWLERCHPHLRRMVHSDEFEEEVSKTGKIEHLCMIK